MKHIILSLLLLLIIVHPATGFTEEPVPRESFITITEHLLNVLNVLENDAKNDNLNQLHNPVIQEKFDTVSASLQEYEYQSPGSVNTWPEGPQKTIASELHATNFHYRAYSMSQHNDFRQEAEKSLQKVRQMLREYMERL